MKTKIPIRWSHQFNLRHPAATRRVVMALGIVAVAVMLLGFTRAREDSGYVAHEWGTFTSVQDADGKLMGWQPLEVADLPEFVYDWSRPGGNRIAANPFGPFAIFSKSSYIALQRMETPVIYFYSDRKRSVDVTVRFPDGYITEWYPQAREIGPSRKPMSPALLNLEKAANKIGVPHDFCLACALAEKPITNSLVQWRNVAILPEAAHPHLANRMPRGESKNHYYAARETDAAFVRVNGLEETNRAPEFDKFLFYRGVGNFTTPLRVTLTEDGRMSVANTGEQPLKHLFALGVRDGLARFYTIDQLRPGEEREVPGDVELPEAALTEVARELRGKLEQALVAEGLYPREAKAMVNTWRDSWFEEPGLRVFHLLPRDWTDRVLPIELDPQPRELVRVMVGRAEIISPRMEMELRREITRFRENDADSRHETVERVRSLIAKRFLQPAFQRALANEPDAEFKKAGWELLGAASVKDKSSPTATVENSAERTRLKAG